MAHALPSWEYAHTQDQAYGVQVFVYIQQLCLERRQVQGAQF